jgi:MFS transporter, SET family, sugar efflux transporter
VLFGADEAQLSPLQVGVSMSVIAVSGLAVSTWLGRRYDRSASRAPAFIALAAPAVGCLALTTTTRYAVLLLIAAAFLGAAVLAWQGYQGLMALTALTFALVAVRAVGQRWP